MMDVYGQKMRSLFEEHTNQAVSDASWDHVFQAAAQKAKKARCNFRTWVVANTFRFDLNKRKPTPKILIGFEASQRYNDFMDKAERRQYAVHIDKKKHLDFLIQESQLKHAEFSRLDNVDPKKCTIEFFEFYIAVISPLYFIPFLYSFPDLKLLRLNHPEIKKAIDFYRSNEYLFKSIRDRI